MGKKNKKSTEIINDEVKQEDVVEIDTKKAEMSDQKKGYKILLKGPTFIVISKNWTEVTIKLPLQELIKYNVNDIYYY